MNVKVSDHTRLMAVVNPTDRPKSICNRCVIEVLVGLFWVNYQLAVEFYVGKMQ